MSRRRVVITGLGPVTAHGVGIEPLWSALCEGRSALAPMRGFDARGLLRNEARLQADLRVASMPDGLDPDEVVARDKDEWKRLIENAKPIVTHVMDSLAVGQNLNDSRDN